MYICVLILDFSSLIFEPITTKVASSNPVHGEVYSIQHLTSMTCGFLWVIRFPPPIKLTATI